MILVKNLKFRFQFAFLLKKCLDMYFYDVVDKKRAF